MSTNNASKAFLGSGMALQINLSPQGQLVMDLGVDGNGEIPISSYDDHVRQSILLILETAKGERVMRPDFGAGLQSLVFSPVDAATAALVQHQVTDALTNFEPRIDVLGVEVTEDSSQRGLLQIDLQYRVRKTDTMFNLVYPFFLERGPY
jgi:phage baseplate assembly protein W